MSETTWIYKQTEPGLWTVGHYDGDQKWHPESDHNSPDEAAARVHWLNGGQPPTATKAPESGWIVIAQRPGMPVDDRDGSPRTGVNMLPCAVEEARNAVGSVRDDRLHRGLTSLHDAFGIAWKQHPSKVHGDREMAAYILDHGDGTYSVAV